MAYSFKTSSTKSFHKLEITLQTIMQCFYNIIKSCLTHHVSYMSLQGSSMTVEFSLSLSL